MCGLLSRRRFLAGAAALGATAIAPRASSAKDGGPKRYRAAAIGHTGRGDYGHDLDRVWLDVPGVQLVAVADADPKGLAEAGKRLGAASLFDDWRKMLAQVKPELLSICPHYIDQRRDMVLAAIEAGVRGIYVEKPLARTLAEADEMVAACAKAGVKVAIAFQTRYSPKLAVIRKLIAEGTIGQVLELRARGKEDQRGGGEDLFVLGPHLMDLMRVLGGDPQSCFATVLTRGRPIAAADIAPASAGIARMAGDEVHAAYRLAGGAEGRFDSVRNAGGGPRFGLWICGSKGVIEMGTNYLPPAYLLAHPSWSAPRSGKVKWTPITSAGLGVPEPITFADPKTANLMACRLGNAAAVKDLIAAIEHDRRPVADITDGRAALEMIAAAFQSQRAGRPVTFPLGLRTDPLAE